MITKIVIYNRFYMDLLVGGMKNIPYEYWQLISISCPDTSSKINSLINEKTEGILKSKGCYKILPLQFDDIRDDQVELCLKNGFNPILFSKDQANQVIDFLLDSKKDLNHSVLVLHCDAGISRSGAIAYFASKLLGVNFFDPYIKPNKYIVRLLWDVIDERKKEIVIK